MADSDLDFLWDCALDTQAESRLQIIPDYEDDMRHFCADNFKSTTNETFYLPVQQTAYVHDAIEVDIIESRGDGVLDIIGGELWEGALLLCSYMLQNQYAFVHTNVLELGSGVGLPGLLLAKLKTEFSGNLNDNSSVTLTDNDPRVMENLNAAVKLQFHTTESPPQDSAADSAAENTDTPSVALHTHLLDWSVFTSESREQIGLSRVSELICEISTGCELIMGCELCYAPYHAKCLANLLKYFLDSGSCRKVVICQMRDREGFAELLINLINMHIPYRLEEISEKLYTTAQQISCTSVSSSTNKVNTQQQRAIHSSCTTKKFTFPARMWGNNASEMEDKRGLLHSPKETFVFVFIG